MDKMNWSNNTEYALSADPNRPLREQKAEIDRLRKQIEEMRNLHNMQLNEIVAERNVYRSLVLKVMNLKD